MREAASQANWVSEDNLHLSVKFFGELPDAAPAELTATLGPVAAAHQPFDLRMSGLGAFPNLRAPRVVWMGVTQDPRLELMHHDVEASCAANGYPLDARAFRPHITLARVRGTLPLANARALALAARAVVYKGVQQVTALALFESTLGPRGPRYAKVAAIPLGGG
jgi:RNA 2',3'-cyclic 3'-phosphodiesterase